MRHGVIIVAMAVLWSGLMSFGIAEDKATESSGSKIATRLQVPVQADLRAEIHRTLAALIEARSAAKPDQAQVSELTAKLQQLRGALRSQNASALNNSAPGWGCPCVGFGRGAGWGCGGCGRGFGPGNGQGRAPGGPAFVDKDHDGVCDYYELRHAVHP
jgi:hypothetical protein